MRVDLRKKFRVLGTDEGVMGRANHLPKKEGRTPLLEPGLCSLVALLLCFAGLNRGFNLAAETMQFGMCPEAERVFQKVPQEFTAIFASQLTADLEPFKHVLIEADAPSDCRTGAVVLWHKLRFGLLGSTMQEACWLSTTINDYPATILRGFFQTLICLALRFTGRLRLLTHRCRVVFHHPFG
jgi:hypothetical protein